MNVYCWEVYFRIGIHICLKSAGSQKEQMRAGSWFLSIKAQFSGLEFFRHIQFKCPQTLIIGGIVKIVYGHLFKSASTMGSFNENLHNAALISIIL